MVLLRNGELVKDEWTRLDADAALPNGPLIVDLDAWQQRRDELLAHEGGLGLQLASDQSPENIHDDLSHFELVALEFPVFTDGRAYSYARLLRERYGFEGELRAVGDVLCEQLLLMHRAGFNAFEMESEDAAEECRVILSEISVWYQPTGDGRKTAIARRHRPSE